MTHVALLVLFCRVSLFVTRFFPPCRHSAGIFFLVFVLLRPCSSCLFLFSTYVFLFVLFFGLMPVSSSSSSWCCFARAAVICSSSARMHVCCSCSLSDLASHSSELLSAFFVFSSYFSYFSGLACFVMFSYQVR